MGLLGGGRQTSVQIDGGMNLESDGALDGHVGGDGAVSTDGSSTGILTLLCSISPCGPKRPV